MKPQPPRTPSKLTDSVHHQLNMYALAASAAGVGMLALSRPAEAKIIYTPAHVVIEYEGVQNYQLDLNHDKITDFSLFITGSCDFGCSFYLGQTPKTGNSAVGHASHGIPLDSALKRGARIRPGGHWIPRRGRLAEAATGTGQSRSSGPWVNVTNRYLGLKFLINGKTHYGWARMTVRVKGIDITATLTGYAYETVPNKPIIAGKTKGPDVITVQPASLGHLARGASAIPVWRVQTSAH